MPTKEDIETKALTVRHFKTMLNQRMKETATAAQIEQDCRDSLYHARKDLADALAAITGDYE